MKGGGISVGIENITDWHYKKRLYIQQDSGNTRNGITITPYGHDRWF